MDALGVFGDLHGTLDDETASDMLRGIVSAVTKCMTALIRMMNSLTPGLGAVRARVSSVSPAVSGVGCYEPAPAAFLAALGFTPCLAKSWLILP